MEKIISVVSVVAGTAEHVELLGEILDVIERNLKELFDGKLSIAILERTSGIARSFVLVHDTYLDESLETSAFGQLFQLQTGIGVTRHVPRERFANQLNLLVEDLSEMVDNRSFRQRLQPIQLISRNSQDLFKKQRR